MPALTPAVSDSMIKSRLAGLLKLADESQMAPWYDAVVADAHEAALNEILGTLVGAGYALAQIQAFDRLAEFEKAISLFWCVTFVGVADQVDDKMLKKLDRRAELEEIDVVNNGQLVLPTNGRIQIGRGDMTPACRDNRQPFDGLGTGDGTGLDRRFSRDGFGGW